jgi:hypothetical protein
MWHVFSLLAFLSLLLLSIVAFAEESVQLVTCPAGYAIRIKRDSPYVGGFVRCEDYDAFQRAQDAGRIEEAGAFLIVPQTPTKDERPKKKRRRDAEPNCYEKKDINVLEL